MKFIKQSEYKNDKSTFEKKSKKPSLTTPDMSYSVRDLLKRFVTGTLPPLSSNNLVYDDDDVTLDSPIHENPVDLMDAIETNKNDVEYLNNLKNVEDSENTLEDNRSSNTAASDSTDDSSSSSNDLEDSK